MSDDVQLPEPAAALLAAAVPAVPRWLRRVTTDACLIGGVDPADLGDELDDVVDVAAARLLDELAELLAADVDEQRTTPLAVCRAAIDGPSRLLRAHGVRPRSGGDPDHRGDDYGLAPANWSDVDASLHEPGLTWGAWKAMTVLRRRRDEGRR